MDTIELDNKWSVWASIKSQPPGKYIIRGSEAILNEFKRLVFDYSNAWIAHYADQFGHDRPFRWYSHTEGDNIPIPGCLVFVSLKHVALETFDPKIPIKGLVYAAIDQIFKGAAEEVEIPCSHTKVQQIRTAVSKTGHRMKVELTPHGCLISKRVASEALPLTQTIRQKITEMAEDGQRKSFKTVMPGQSAYVRVLVSNIAKEFRLEVGCSINGSDVELWIKPDPLIQAMDYVIAKWTGKGRHHLEVLEAMREAVERYKRKMVEGVEHEYDRPEPGLPEPPSDADRSIMTDELI